MKYLLLNLVLTLIITKWVRLLWIFSSLHQWRSVATSNFAPHLSPTIPTRVVAKLIWNHFFSRSFSHNIVDIRWFLNCFVDLWVFNIRYVLCHQSVQRKQSSRHVHSITEIKWNNRISCHKIESFHQRVIYTWEEKLPWISGNRFLSFMSARSLPVRPHIGWIHYIR